MKSHMHLISPEDPVSFLKIILCDDTGSTGLAWKVVASRYLGKADWMTFVEDNGVNVGDVLVIEMIHKDKDVLGVTICRCSWLGYGECSGNRRKRKVVAI
ncbi:putative transcription factor B3-Domain family [Helianthus anomalus]